MADSDRHIGIFDSGLGGLTVLKAVHRLMPHEKLLYFGDTAHVPYGSKSAETVTAFSLQICRFLVENRVKLIIVACNTASALALEELRRKIKVPVFGVIEPGAKAAIAATKNLRVGVIGTEATVKSQAYRRALEAVAPAVQTVGLACPLFVPLVEEGWWNKQITALAAREYLRPLKNSGADTLILGCTHYPVIKPVISKVLGKKVALVDSAEAVAEETRAYLKANRLTRAGGKSSLTFYASDDPVRFKKLAKNILGLAPKIVCLKRFD